MKNNNTLIYIALGVVAIVFLTKKQEVQVGTTTGGWAGQAQGFANAMATAAQSAANTTSQLVNDLRGAAQQRRDNDFRSMNQSSDIINGIYYNNPMYNSYF